MEWWHAIILGIVEGVTEYLPVSSTGHLLLTQRLLSIPQGEAADAYAICIQTGAILAVLGIYWQRVKQMLLGIMGKDEQGLQLAINIIVAFMPAAVIGLLFDSAIEEYLFGIWPITIAWFVGGIVILLVCRRIDAKRTASDKGKELVELTWRMALIIGFAQCLAMWPGTSRSLVTILAGVLVGLRLGSAVEFSFLLGVLTLTAATGYKALQSGMVMLEAYSVVTMFTGFVFAAISAAIAVKWMVAYLNKHSLSIFGIYRIALACGVAFFAGYFV